MQLLKKIVFSTFLLFLLNLSYAQTDNNNVKKFSKARIYFNTINDLQVLSKNGVIIDHGISKTKLHIESVFSTLEITIAKKLGFKVVILIDDMQKYILNRNKNKSQTSHKNAEPCEINSNEYSTPNNFNLGTMGGFLTYAQIEQELDDMHTIYPNLITQRVNIDNYTTANSNTLQWVKISDNPDTEESEPNILYNALHHAREPASMQQLIFYMWYLLENYETNSEVKAIVDNTQLYFIPVVNPDGYIYNESTNPNGGGFWRKNRLNNGNGTFGVDNNRNYNYIDSNGNSVWNTSGTSNSTSADNYAGTGPFSEVENQALKWFVEQHDFSLALNNHTHGNLLLYPFSYQNVQTVDNDTYIRISNEMASQNSFNNILSADLYFAAGDADDFMYGETSSHSKIFSMTPEIGSSFWPEQNTIIPICKSMMYLNLTAAHLVNDFAILDDTNSPFIALSSGNLNYTLKNLGLNGLANFTVSIVPISSNLNVGSSNQHNNLAQFVDVSGTISYTLDSSITIGDTIDYKLIIDNGFFTTEKIVSKIFGTPQLLITDTGNDLSNWNTTSQWNTTNSDFFSSSSSITDSPSGNYNNNQNSILELTDIIDLTSARLASVSFYSKWDIEVGYDYVQFEISTDNGSTWQPQCGKYTKAGVANQGVIDQPVYDGNQNIWVNESIDLNDYLGQIIKMRFQLVSDGGVTNDGFYFDDFMVTIIDESVLDLTDYQLLNIQVYPNPAKENITIYTPNINSTFIRIYNVTGQLIKELKTQTPITTINLSNLSVGVYYIQLQNKIQNISRKIIKK